MKNPLNLLIGCVSLWCAGIMITPIIAAACPTASLATSILYRSYGVVCHQFESHSFHIHEHPFTVCIRCTAIYVGFLVALIGIRFSSPLRNKRCNPVYLLIFSSLPMMVDIAGSLTSYHEISTLSRLITGAIFGIGLAFLLHRSLTEIIFSLLPYHSYETKTR